MFVTPGRPLSPGFSKWPGFLRLGKQRRISSRYLFKLNDCMCKSMTFNLLYMSPLRCYLMFIVRNGSLQLGRLGARRKWGYVARIQPGAEWRHPTIHNHTVIAFYHLKKKKDICKANQVYNKFRQLLNNLGLLVNLRNVFMSSRSMTSRSMTIFV